MKTTFLLIASLLICTIAHAQITIKGQVLDETTDLGLGYASIVNQRSQAGTITNDDGYFELAGIRATDTLVVSYVGYKTYKFLVTPNKSYYQIVLAYTSMQLQEIVVTPKINEYLYDLIIATKKNAHKVSAQAKSYPSIFVNESS